MARDTKEMQSAFAMDLSFPVAASTTIEKGKFVAVNAGGYLVEMSATTGLHAVGRAEEDVDNSSGANGALNCKCRQGIFKWANDATDTVVAADIGDTAYGEGDDTVGNDNTGTSVAGRIVQLDTDGVWVATQYTQNA